MRKISKDVFEVFLPGSLKFESKNTALAKMLLNFARDREIAFQFCDIAEYAAHTMPAICTPPFMCSVPIYVH